MTPDRNSILATMYQTDTDDTPDTPPTSNRTRKIRVGIIEYEVPTIEYVQQLEQQVVRLTRTVERMENAQRLQNGNLETMRNYVNRKEQDNR
jgi:TolA-binding protein